MIDMEELIDDLGHDLSEYRDLLDDNSTWEGTDVNKLISLGEYHMLVNMDSDDDDTYDVLHIDWTGNYVIDSVSISELINDLPTMKKEHLCSYGDYNPKTLQHDAHQNPIAFIYTYYSYFGL